MSEKVLWSEKAEAIVAVQQHTKPSGVSVYASFSSEPLLCPEESPVLSPENSCQNDTTEEIDPGYRKHVSDGFVSLVGSEKKSLSKY